MYVISKFVMKDERRRRKNLYLRKISKDLERYKAEVFKLGQVHYTVELVWPTLFIIVPCK